MGPLGQRNYGSLGALLSHALACYAEHSDFAQGETMRGYLEQRDLYCRHSLKLLQPQEIADLLAWAEAFSVLSFIAKDGLLERFASHAPESWAALCALGDAAKRAGCTDESPYALLADGGKLRALVAELQPSASKLMRLLPWAANPVVPASVNAIGGSLVKSSGTRQRTAERLVDDLDGVTRLVRVRFNNSMWERSLDWDEIGDVRMHEPSPGRIPAAALLHGGASGGPPRFGRPNLAGLQ